MNTVIFESIFRLGSNWDAPDMTLTNIFNPYKKLLHLLITYHNK